MKSKPKVGGKRKKISEHKREIQTSTTVMERIKKSQETRKIKGKVQQKQSQRKDNPSAKSIKATKGEKLMKPTKKRKVSDSSDTQCSENICMGTDEEEFQEECISSSDEELPEEIDLKAPRSKIGNVLCSVL